MAISDTINSIKTHLNNAYASINSKGGAIPTNKNINNLSQAIDSIPQGTPEPIIEGTGKYPVRFFDCKGNLLKIQYCNKGENATAPEIPIYDGLTFVKWNRTFTNIQFDIDTCAICEPTDGKLHAFCKFTEKTGKSPLISFRILTGSGSSANKSITIDWGDGTGEIYSNLNMSTTYSYGHTYDDYGEYEITIKTNQNVNDINIGASQGQYKYEKCFLGDCTPSREINPNNALIKLWLCGTVRGLNANVLANCENLEELITPYLRSVSGYSIRNCPKLKFLAFIVENYYGTAGSQSSNFIFNCMNLERIVLPDLISAGTVVNLLGYSSHEKLIMGNVISTSTTLYGIGNYNTKLTTLVFPQNAQFKAISTYNCMGSSNLRRILFPPNIEDLNVNSFLSNCRSLKKIKIPPKVTKLGNSFFNTCEKLSDVYMYPHTPPVLGGTGVFPTATQNSFLKVHVYPEDLTKYQNATNYSSLGTRLIGDLEGEYVHELEGEDEC